VTTTGQIESVESTESGVIVRLRMDRIEGDPIAPGWCGWPKNQVVQHKLVLHRLLERVGNVVTLENLDHTETVPPTGIEVEYTSWWDPHQLALVTDVTRQWASRLTSDANDSIDSCDFCGLCWARILDQDGAYESRGDWICTDCFERYIVDDFLGIRGP